MTDANSTDNNFTAAPVPIPTYSIEGVVSGATKEGVTINLTGATTATTTSGADGSYSFTGLLNGSYTVTPVKTGYTFTPSSSGVNVSGANMTGNDFEAAVYVEPTYTISGAVSGVVLEGVTIDIERRRFSFDHDKRQRELQLSEPCERQLYRNAFKIGS